MEQLGYVPRRVTDAGNDMGGNIIDSIYDTDTDIQQTDDISTSNAKYQDDADEPATTTTPPPLLSAAADSLNGAQENFSNERLPSYSSSCSRKWPSPSDHR